MARQEIWGTKDPLELIFSPRVVPPGYVPYHWHDAYEFNFEIEGSFQIFINHVKYDAGPGDFFATNPGEFHSFESKTGDTSITMIIPSDFFRRFAPNSPLPVFPNVFPPEQKAEINRRIRYCNELYEAGLKGNSLAFFGELFYFLSYLYELRIKDARLDQIAMTETQKQRLEQLSSFVEEHYREPVTLEEAAGLLHLQTNYFCRFFKKVTGMSFMEYLNEYRIINIYQDLVNTSDPVGEIMRRHGFYDSKVFRKYFFKRYQATPSQVRQRHAISQYGDLSRTV